MTGTAAGLRLIEHGIAELTAFVNLQPTPSGSWTDTGLRITLPSAGTYQLDATVRAAMIATSPGTTYIRARLYDETAGIVVPLSDLFVLQFSITASSGPITTGEHGSGPIQTEYTVPGPSVVRLEASRTVAQGTTNTSWIYGGPDGRTTLRYARIA